MRWERDGALATPGARRVAGCTWNRAFPPGAPPGAPRLRRLPWRARCTGGAGRHGRAGRAWWVGRVGRGQATAEFALLLPVLFLLLAGIIDLGRSYQAYIAITNASREGARYASQRGGSTGTAQDTAGIQKRVRRELEGMNLAGALVPNDASAAGSIANLTTTVACFDSTGASIACTLVAAGGSVKVTAAYNVSLITGSMLSWAVRGSFPNPVPISGAVEMRVIV